MDRAARSSDLAARDPQRLSGGQAQLVALASVLALRPAYLVLDEPTSQLDPQGTLLVGDALAAIAAEAGTGILLVEHKRTSWRAWRGGSLCWTRAAWSLQGDAAHVLGRSGNPGPRRPAAVRGRAGHGGA